MECSICNDTGYTSVSDGLEGGCVDFEPCVCASQNMNYIASLEAKQMREVAAQYQLFDEQTLDCLEAYHKSGILKGVALQKAASNPTTEKAATNI